jgi:hypothetical protein
MPDQEHLILVLARDAEEVTRDMSVFFAPTRDFIEPGADWPPDLGPGELAALIPQLRLTIGHLADVLGQIILDNKGDPDKAKLVSEGVRLIEQGEQAVRAGETLFGAPASPPGTLPQQEVAAQDFPHGAAAAPATGTSLATPEVGPANPGRAPAQALVPGTQADQTRLNR